MRLKITTSIAWSVVAALSMPAHAFNFGNMMNPSDWFGGNRDDDYYYDDYYGPPGAYGYPGYGSAPYGAPAYAAPAPGYAVPGYTAPGYGYGAPGYAAPGYTTAPGYAAPAYSAPQQPAATTTSKQDADEIARLKQRVRELEDSNARAIESWQTPVPQQQQAMPAAPVEYAPPVAANPAAPATGSQAPAEWQPSYSAPGTPGAFDNSSYTIGGNPADYKPPQEYPGQRSYELGR